MGGYRRNSRENRTQLFGRKKGEPRDIDLNLIGRRESNTVEDGERNDKNKTTRNAWKGHKKIYHFVKLHNYNDVISHEMTIPPLRIIANLIGEKKLCSSCWS